MKKKYTIGILTLAITLILVACESRPTQATAPTLSDNLKQSGQQAAQNQTTLEKAQPAPKLTYSLERQNQIERAKKINDQNRIGYLYELSDDGKVINYFVVKGKVSSMQSYLVPDQQIVKDPYFEYFRVSGSSMQTSQGMTVQAPDIDGSYGTNQDGIYFFEPDGTMHEWNGKYHYSEKALKMTSQPVLVQEKK